MTGRVGLVANANWYAGGLRSATLGKQPPPVFGFPGGGVLKHSSLHIYEATHDRGRFDGLDLEAP